MSRMLYTRICADCGKVMHGAGPNRKRCPECSRLHSAALKHTYNKTEHEQKKRRQRERLTEARSQSLHAAALAATQAGTSYGKYMLAKQKKPAGAEAPTSRKG